LNAMGAGQARPVQVVPGCDSRFAADQSVLVWDHVCFGVDIKGQHKEILKSVSGKLIAGQCTAIMGPSGSGKTSLLNLLAGRVRPKAGFKVSGDITVDDKRVVPSKCRHMFGYVMQDDALFATATPRETLRFAARLRLPHMSKDALAKRCVDLLDSLGIAKCADAYVGSAMIKGISGGEKKRTAIATELVTDPSIVFLDEPTSGLDSHAAYRVCQVLRELADKSKLVMCTIHQPSSEVLHLFHSVIFLASGKVIFQGPPKKIREHFASLGYICGDGYNPADFVMFLLQTLPSEKLDALAAAWTEAQSQGGAGRGEEMAVIRPRTSAGFAVELMWVFRREVKNVLRDKGTLGARFGGVIFLSILLAVIFQGSGDASDTRYDIQTHFGAVFQISLQVMMGALQPVLLTFIPERPVIIREYAAGTYGLVPYFISKTLAELPLALASTVLTWLITYFAVDCAGSFFVLVAGSFMLAIVASSLALVIACSVPTEKMAMELGPMAFVPQLLFAGFFVKIELIPVVLRWLQHVFPLKFGINILMIEEFQGTVPGRQILKQSDIEIDGMWKDFVVLGGMFVAFRSLSLFMLFRRSQAVYN